MTSKNQHTPWCIIDPVTGIKYVNNLEYLNYLNEKTHEIIQSQDRILIQFLYWDWTELQQAGLGPLYDLTITSQINSLKRILSYDSLKKYRQKCQNKS